MVELTEEEEDALNLTGLPGALRRAWMRDHPGEEVPEPADEPDVADA